MRILNPRSYSSDIDSQTHPRELRGGPYTKYSPLLASVRRQFRRNWKKSCTQHGKADAVRHVCPAPFEHNNYYVNVKRASLFRVVSVGRKVVKMRIRSIFYPKYQTNIHLLLTALINMASRKTLTATDERSKVLSGATRKNMHTRCTLRLRSESESEKKSEQMNGNRWNVWALVYCLFSLLKTLFFYL